jgi:hypothetical protein
MLSLAFRGGHCIRQGNRFFNYGHDPRPKSLFTREVLQIRTPTLYLETVHRIRIDTLSLPADKKIGSSVFEPRDYPFRSLPKVAPAGSKP